MFVGRRTSMGGGQGGFLWFQSTRLRQAYIFFFSFFFWLLRLVEPTMVPTWIFGAAWAVARIGRGRKDEAVSGIQREGFPPLFFSFWVPFLSDVAHIYSAAPIIQVTKAWADRRRCGEADRQGCRDPRSRWGSSTWCFSLCWRQLNSHFHQREKTDSQVSRENSSQSGHDKPEAVSDNFIVEVVEVSKRYFFLFFISRSSLTPFFLLLIDNFPVGFFLSLLKVGPRLYQGGTSISWKKPTRSGRGCLW